MGSSTHEANQKYAEVFHCERERLAVTATNTVGVYISA